MLNLDESHRFAAIEMGASAPGEIHAYCQWARPGVALVNNVAPAHLVGFGTLEGVARAKGEIYQSLDADGLAIINLDEPFSSLWLELVNDRPRLTYGSAASADVRGSDVRLEGDGCCSFLLHIHGSAVRVTLPIPGRHNVANALAAAAIARAVGLELEDIAAGLAGVPSVSGRMKMGRGLNGARLIDDSYNANPGSVRAAIDTLVSFAGRRVLVLGDMAELGATAAQLHREVGQYAREQGVDELWTVGQFSEEAATAFGASARHCASRDDLAAKLGSVLNTEVTVLVKGSRSAGMEAVVAALKGEVS